MRVFTWDDSLFVVDLGPSGPIDRMRIISKRKLREFWLSNSDAERALSVWYAIVRKMQWTSFSDVRATFRHADVYKDCVIFDVGGNKFRIVAKVRFGIGRVYVRSVMTHKEYDCGLWKRDCED